MAMGSYTRKEQSQRECEISYCRCVVTVLQVVFFCQNVSTIAAQGYSNLRSNTGHHAMFSRQPPKLITDDATINEMHISSLMDRVQFDPPYLDFGSHPIGIPATRLVYIYNPSDTRPLELVSISASTAHFHSSFFDEKIVLAKCNTSFEVVFLARVMGNVENTLFINTAIGTFSYQVFGTGTSNPYRLRPYLGARVSLNSSFSPLISMHNPTGTPLQVTEMYTSSGFLHLQLPTGRHEATKKAWEIPPYETKLIMRASFLGQIAENHTAFIRIKTNQTDVTQYLILPVEVEVSSAPGIYSSLDLLDFGTLRTKDDPKALNLFLLNSGKKDVQISSVTCQPENPAVFIDFKAVRLKPSEALYTRVANISFDVKQVRDESNWSGKIIVRTKEKSFAKIAIPFQANVLNGTLGYNETDTFFHIPSPSSQPVKRAVSLTNSFLFPVILHKLELHEDASTYYTISSFSSPVLIPSQGTIASFEIECKPTAVHALGKKSDGHVSLLHELILHTNTSTFSLPLQAFTGFLKFKVEHGTVRDLNFGIMGTLDKRHMVLEVYNHSPLPIPLLNCNCTVDGITVQILSLTRSGEEVQPIISSLFKNILLPPDSCLVLQVEISAPEVETVLNGTLNIYTKYETLKVALKAKIAVGTLVVKPAKSKFPPSFPGMTVHYAISITSSFSQTTKIESVTSLDKRFYYRKLKNVVSELEPEKETKIGKLYFDPRQDCKPDRCYVGLPTSTTVGHHWLTTLNLGKEAPDVDLKLYKTLRERWKNLQRANATSLNSTFEMSTSLVRDFPIIAHASLYWPTLLVDLEETNLRFPLTHVGKQSVSEITLYNPGDFPVIMQLLPITVYPQPRAVLDVLDWTRFLEKEGFIINNQNIFSVSAPNSSAQDIASQMMWLEYTLSGKTNSSCINMFLNPGQKQKIEITFAPERAASVSTVILLRNNLTVIDALLVEGTGVKEELKLGGKLSNRQESLRFRLTETLLRDCLTENRKETPTFTVRKSFTAKNLGLLPLQVMYVMVDNYPCEGYGFRVLECERFLLQPNETRDIIIAFTPDFTTSEVHRTLRLVTQQGNILTFNLNVTLPHRMLPACQKAVPRPSWERNLYLVVTMGMAVIFIGTMAAATLEALNIWEPFHRLYEIDKESSVEGNSNPESENKIKPFNLQQIATNYISNVQVHEQPKSSKRPRLTSHHRTNSRRPGWWASMKETCKKLLYLDVLNAMRSWRRKPSHNAVKADLSSTEDLENNVFKNSELAQNVSDLIRETRVSSLVPSKPRHKSSGRKGKSNQGDWNGKRGSKSAAVTPAPVDDSMEKEEIPWSPPENLEYEKEKTPLREPPVNKLSSTSSSSSIESSRSRGSSLSSGTGESAEKNKTPDSLNEGGKRRRKNKLARQQATTNENDDTSSTTTEKSNEDYEVTFDRWKNDWPVTRSDTNKSSKTKRSPLFVAKQSTHNSADSPYSNANENNGVRRRHTRPTTNSNNTKYEKSNGFKPQAIQKTTSIAGGHFYDTSSTDEPVWDLPKPKNDPDEGMRVLAEQTQKADNRMRTKMSPKKKVTPQRRDGSNSPFFNNASSSSENKESSASKAFPAPKRNKPSLSKTKSAPEPIPQNNFHPTSSYSPDTNSKSIAPTFSMFSSPGTQDSVLAKQAQSVSRRLPAWDNFGQNSFNITGLMPQVAPAVSEPLASSAHWEPISSSLFSTPSSSPVWASSNALLTNTPPPPGSPTTPTPSMMMSSGMNSSWNNASTPSPLARTTHAIWSVSNAVTMDEDRNTAESDPLGLKSIWNSTNSCPTSNDNSSTFF